MSGYAAAVVGIAMLATVTACNGVVHFTTQENIQGVVVTDKERVNTKERSYYLVYSDQEVFTNEDSLWALKWNSSDVQAHIKNGSTCNFVVTGFRIPFFSAYRNIIEANCKVN